MNEKIKAIPLVVPPTDAFLPYVQRAETAATNAEAAAKRAEDAVAALPSPEDFGRFFVDASGATGKVTLTRQSGDTVEVPISADSVANLRGRQNSTAYSVGDVALWDGLPSWAFLVCRTSGISATVPPHVGGRDFRRGFDFRWLRRLDGVPAGGNRQPRSSGGR